MTIATLRDRSGDLASSFAVGPWGAIARKTHSFRRGQRGGDYHLWNGNQQRESSPEMARTGILPKSDEFRSTARYVWLSWTNSRTRASACARRRTRSGEYWACATRRATARARAALKMRAHRHQHMPGEAGLCVPCPWRRTQEGLKVACKGYQTHEHHLCQS